MIVGGVEHFEAILIVVISKQVLKAPRPLSGCLLSVAFIQRTKEQGISGHPG